MKIYKTL